VLSLKLWNAVVHTPDFLGRLAVDYREMTTLTETYSKDHPPASVHAADLVTYHGGIGTALRDARAPLHATGDLPPFFYEKAWNVVFACEPPEQVWFGYGRCTRSLGRPWPRGLAGSGSSWPRSRRAQRRTGTTGFPVRVLALADAGLGDLDVFRHLFDADVMPAQVLASEGRRFWRGYFGFCQTPIVLRNLDA
jgi:hypothetical protein